MQTSGAHINANAAIADARPHDRTPLPLLGHLQRNKATKAMPRKVYKFRHGLLQLSIAVILLTLAACTHTESTPPAASTQAVRLPHPPRFLGSVPTPAVKAGDDARLAWKRDRAALEQANRRLEQSRNWYDGVRGRYGGAIKSAAKLKKSKLKKRRGGGIFVDAILPVPALPEPEPPAPTRWEGRGR